jgi:hypothetical protein
MPYAAALLDLYTSAMSRHAFELDFMSPGIEVVIAKVAQLPVPQAAAEAAVADAPIEGKELAETLPPPAQDPPQPEAEGAAAPDNPDVDPSIK